MKQRRLLVLAAAAAIMFLIWSFFHQSEEDVIQRLEINGRVTEIHQKLSPANNKPNNKPNSIVVAVVELDGPTVTEDGHARILVRKGQFAVGDQVPLLMKRYKDGSRKVILRSIEEE